MNTERPLVFGVRFGKGGKVYHFDASAYRELVVGDTVVVGDKPRPPVSTSLPW